MPNVGWKSLEGKPWKLDVGSTMQEALQSKDNSTLHLTTNNGIVMNGEIFGKTDYLKFVNSDEIFALSPGATEDEILHALAIKLPTESIVWGEDKIWEGILCAFENGAFIYDRDKTTRIDLDLKLYDSEVFHVNLLTLRRMSIKHNRPSLEYTIIKVEENSHDIVWSVLSSSNGSSIINEPKLSEPDFKVFVRKALPMYPRKGMKYYFDNGVKYNLPKKVAFDHGFTFTVPDDGNTWVVCGFKGDKSDKVIPNGTVIDKTNLLEFFPELTDLTSGYSVITKKVGKPVIVIVQKDGESVFSKDAIYEQPLNGDESLNCLDKYRKIVKGKLVYDIPLPDLRKGDEIPPYGYDTFKYRLKRLKYYGKNLPNGTSIDNEYYVLTSGGERKKAYRMLRSSRGGTVYIARAIPSKRRGCGKDRRLRFILSPKVKYYVDRSGKIKKRL